MDPHLYFREKFREARYIALKDAEGYQRILFVLERLGAYMVEKGCHEEHEHEKADSLGDYKNCITALVKKYHPLEKDRKRQPSTYRDCHTAFGSLYEMVMHGRNDALHQGAFGRILTLHLVQLALFLEDTLMTIMTGEIKNYMTRNPMCASEWQPVSFVRQMMLANSFTYIPVYLADIPVSLRERDAKREEAAWYIITDCDIAMYLQPFNSDCRAKRLAKSIKDVIKSGEMHIEKAATAPPDKPVRDVLTLTEGKKPILVKRDDCNELLGIATTFDLM